VVGRRAGAQWQGRLPSEPGRLARTKLGSPVDSGVGAVLLEVRPRTSEASQRALGKDEQMKQVDLFRHTDNDGDRLTMAGVAAAERIGRAALNPPYDAFVSSGAARATQMLEILRSAAGQNDVPITEQPGLRSSVEDRWRGAAKLAGKGADVEQMRAVDTDLVEKESLLLGRALKQVLDDLPDGGRALVVGHSPTNEAAVLGLAAIVVPPMGKGDGLVVIDDDGRYRVEERPNS